MVEREVTLIGRDGEIAALKAQLSGPGSGLVLLVGAPRMGKASLLVELRRRAEKLGLSVVPTQDSFYPKPYLTVDRQTTISEFEDALRSRAVTDDISSWDKGPRRVVLVYGYRPDADFRSWFVDQFLPELAAFETPTTLVIAAIAEDVLELEPFCAEIVRVDPLPRDVVSRELESISSGIADQLEDNELDYYVDAVIADPTLLEAFRLLLPMSMTGGSPTADS